MKISSMKRFYNIVIMLGNISTGLLFFFVLELSGWNWLVLLWMIPLVLFIEFGCFACENKKHIKEEK